MKKTSVSRWCAFLILLGLWGCAARQPAETGAATPPPAPAQEKTAAQILLESAQADRENGRVAAAKAALERGLRIEPRNPLLWQELARVHMQEGDYQQAENFAARSNSWAAGNRGLLAANWHLIAEARARRGDAYGAQAAFEKEKQFGE